MGGGGGMGLLKRPSAPFVKGVGTKYLCTGKVSDLNCGLLSLGYLDVLIHARNIRSTKLRIKFLNFPLMCQNFVCVSNTQQTKAGHCSLLHAMLKSSLSASVVATKENMVNKYVIVLG